MPRQTNGWGDCVNCGEQLTPQDEERWSDRCPFCLKLTAVFQLVNHRHMLAEKGLKEVEKMEPENPKAIEHWTSKKAAYLEIHAILRDALKVKKDKLWGEGY
ncbi:unnamed protein product [marine sediment metagenome]|uniref:Uncharacterized protein n=1 Tax=marine sediment metagenome TaxID=412755 RepID=X1BN49_9ZZZZ